jgi:methyl-accepting chemotaxis protein
MSTDSSGSGADGEDALSPLQVVTPNFIRESFALKFALVLLVLGISIGIIGLAATDQVKQETQENVLDESERVASQEGDLVEQWVRNHRLSARLVSSNSEWAANEGFSRQLQIEQGQLQGDIVGMHLTNGTGTASYIQQGSPVTDSTTLDDSVSVAEANRNWIAGETFNSTSEVKMSTVYRVDGEPVVGFVSPVETSSFTRYLLVEVELNAIADSLQGAERAEGGFTEVVNSSGTVMIAEPRDGSTGIGDSVLASYSNGEADQPITAANSLRQSSQSVGVNDDKSPNEQVIDERYVVGYAPVPDTDWVVLTHAPHSAVFGFVQDVQRWGLIATLIEILLIAGVGAALGYSTSTAIGRLTNKAEEMRQGNLDVEISSNRVDNIGQLYGAFGDMAESLKNQIDEAQRSRKEAEVSRAEAMEMANYLEEKAEEFSDAMSATAGGDLTQRMETDGENDSMDRIAREFNEMIEELEKTTGQLTSFADEVAESGEVVLSSAESVREASEQVAESIQKISDEAYDQEERLQAVSEDLDALVESLEQIADENDDIDISDPLSQFKSVATAIQEAADTSEQMMAESENVAGAAEEQAAELNEVSSRAEKLKRYARPLGDILNRFETEAEHEFVFSGGPSQSTADEDEE